jgi:hypothetical protein
MQKIFSTRLEEATIDELTRAARRLGVPKRQFIEDAIRQHAQALVGDSDGEDVWAETAGAWRRSESAKTTVARARRAFDKSFMRHRTPHARVRR